MIKQMVDSEEIAWIGYEHKTQMLQVEFIIGGIYQFDHVPECVYESFLVAKSYDQFFEKEVKGQYPFRRCR